VLFRIFERGAPAPAALIQSSIQTETHEIGKSSRICKQISPLANFVQGVAMLRDASDMEPAPLCAEVRLFGCQLHNTAALLLDQTLSATASFNVLGCGEVPLEKAAAGMLLMRPAGTASGHPDRFPVTTMHSGRSGVVPQHAGA
jgi:hypothetical protein